MKTIITSETDIEQYAEVLPASLRLIHFKMVGIGSNTMQQAGFLGHNLCKIVRDVPGFFIVTEDGQDVRAAMHDLVDRFCDKQEGKNEPKKQAGE